LARLEALKAEKSQDTVIITVPQAIVPVMLPVLQQVFPDDRHVFGYTGCIPAVQTALYRRATAPRAVVPDHMSEAVRFTNPVAITTPMASHRPSPNDQYLDDTFQAFAGPACPDGGSRAWMVAMPFQSQGG
jgi:hypothetical protein